MLLKILQSSGQSPKAKYYPVQSFKNIEVEKIPTLPPYGFPWCLRVLTSLSFVFLVCKRRLLFTHRSASRSKGGKDIKCPETSI